MKIELWCGVDNNIHSCRREIIDLVEDLGYTEEICAELTHADIQKIANEWANDHLNIGGCVVED